MIRTASVLLPRHARRDYGGLTSQGIYSTFLRKEQPSVKRALPPVGWHKTVEQDAQKTTVAAWLKTVVIWKQPGHLTSMKNEFGD